MASADVTSARRCANVRERLAAVESVMSSAEAGVVLHPERCRARASHALPDAVASADGLAGSRVSDGYSWALLERIERLFAVRTEFSALIGAKLFSSSANGLGERRSGGVESDCAAAPMSAAGTKAMKSVW